MPILSEEDLERFRTKVCTLASSMRCDFGVERCNYSHNLYWARRCPFYLRDSSILRYIPACCPDVELGPGSAILKNTCPRGNNCAFAHSLEEMHYHPLVYKTQVCSQYRDGNCRTYYCHMVHGLAEYRVPRQFVLPRKRGLNIPAFEHVTIIDNIRNFHSQSSTYALIRERLSGKSDTDPRISVMPLSFLHTSQPSPQLLNLPTGQMQCKFQVHSTDQGKAVSIANGVASCVTNNQTQYYSGCTFQPNATQPGNQAVNRMSSKEALLDALSSDPGKSEGVEKLNTIRWTDDMVETSSYSGSSKMDSSSRFPLLFSDESSSEKSATMKREPDDLSKIAEYSSSLRLTSRVDDSVERLADGSTPWFDRVNNAASTSAGAPTPTYTISNLDTIIQASMEESDAKNDADAESGNQNHSTSQLINYFGGPNVVRNISGWKGSSTVPLSLQCASEDGVINEEVTLKDINKGLLGHVYRTVAQQCELIAGKCVATSNDRSNLSSICNDAHNLWQLLVSIQTLLYESESGKPEDVANKCQKGHVDTAARRWTDMSSFLSDLVDAYESENAKTTTIDTIGAEDSVSCSADAQ
ncbi:uncharacterized protein BXIN_3044 [Babesia sp. Xinjiang]|uniref:uncharacterized protein n=1 Tax=Babesia sp. Xinjiang TaxID=462227 RepID=UPI000A258A91|nr:uncharacterized protein BXIN_3044 [Babesia sp. Xinjiang]ORM39502.1 hypothetical protein BXIN_3044 [Babesia sp. Xinjiang]